MGEAVPKLCRICGQDCSRRDRVRNAQGQMVRLGTVMDVRDTSGPVMVMRYNLYQAAPITGNLQPGVSSGDAIAAIDRLAAEPVPTP